MKIVTEAPDPRIKWDLYWTMADNGEVSLSFLSEVNLALTMAAIRAIETNDARVWYKTARQYAAWGADDSEPHWQFEAMWREAGRL